MVYFVINLLPSLFPSLLSCLPQLPIMSLQLLQLFLGNLRLRQVPTLQDSRVQPSPWVWVHHLIHLVVPHWEVVGISLTGVDVPDPIEVHVPQVVTIDINLLLASHCDLTLEVVLCPILIINIIWYVTSSWHCPFHMIHRYHTVHRRTPSCQSADALWFQWRYCWTGLQCYYT